MHGLISQILLSCWSSNRIYWLDEKIAGAVLQLVLLTKPNQATKPAQNPSEGNPAGFEMSSSQTSQDHQYSSLSSFFSGRMKMEISMPAEKPEHAWIWQGRHVQGEPGLCGTPNSYLSLHILLFNHHLQLCVPFPSAWRSGVGPNSSRTFISNWRLPGGSLVGLY